MQLHPYLHTQREVMVLAHRGSSGKAPENTLPAFAHAAELGVDALECDIHATRDGVLVVAHDDHLDRVTDGSGRIHDHTWDELRRFDAGYHWSPDGRKTHPFRGQGLHLPRLETLFDRFGHFRFNIDIKQTEPSIIRPFVELIERYDMARRLMVGSFDSATVREFRNACPDAARSGSLNEIRLFYVLHRLRLSWLYCPNADAFQLPEETKNRRVVTPSFIRAVQHHGIHIHIWTVNETADMRRLLDWDVDGIITDHPQRLLTLLESRRGHGSEM